MDLTAANSELIGQVRGFVHWVGAGRKLTQTGRITRTDARTLVPALGTDDVIDPTIGDRVFRTTSSQELLHLTLIVEWAKSARLVRKTGNRLVPVKKNAALLDDAPGLWLALFTVFDQLGDAFLPTGIGESLMRLEFATGIRSVLISLHRAEDAVATASLCATAWDTVTAPYVLDHVTETQLTHWRAYNDRDMDRALNVLCRLGAVMIDDGAVELTELGRSGISLLLGEPAPGDPIYQVNVTLLEMENPPVWRRVLVPATIRLDRLHEIIQAAMGWQNAHLHAFIDGQTYYGVPDPELPHHDERKTRLNELVKPGDHLQYTYDFGDDWEHDITIEEATVAKPGTSYPLCVAGQGACPPEDAGGWPGYTRLVQILTDPGHEGHQDMLDWLGLDNRDQFDPTRFAPDDANQRLSAVSHTGPIVSRR
ncbi:plasmid pRiA4b ORF-3 family protein [Amycolatopsis sp. H20-H5]|uniref:plasmid pRiA4b ORF-3 family protein n=1 Tax=Amycolatopsis sp. H20-H5 TaxID=3046309 RepID=UPI002DBE252A|nr:plasmid pRiA4b ORF-3 family protein [Amycolatopsis sp. H20-H5]MEC3978731.1 plasmid pRiA4b ORF-3 family protein [Amycolatopsis sp. H20-H5]